MAGSWWETLLGGVGSVLETADLGYGVGQAIADLDLFGFKKPPSMPARTSGGYGAVGFSAAPGGGPPGPIANAGIQGVNALVPNVYGGGSMNGDWSGDYGMTLTRGRSLIPYSGGVIPSGYRVAMRRPRAPTSGYPGGAYLVPRRSMNVLNPRALMRAERRLSGFSKWVKRHFTIAKHAPKRRKVGGRKRR